ncbi:hypothetical protein [Bacillus sp. mrc49]|uniref:hypothetical protein n=1 Tax=Bacillus sp. mrc49 TaxID=2054913 RepID=UPI000C26E870|nr:hypothetical protein [Bacillus sp. mrc49]PJN90702.1 hypothetical protein CVN76_09300 [Bacillus sp. mrc49]
MNITDILVLSVVLGLINGFKDKGNKVQGFFTIAFTFFTTGLIFNITGKLFLDDFLDEYFSSEEYGVWLFGGLFLLFSIYLTIKGLRKKTRNSLH